MSSFATLLLFGSLAITTGTRSVSRLRHGGKMNPEAVAHTLVAVEEKWVTDAVAFAQCNASDTTCQEDVLGQYKKSCQTVVRAIIQSSNGDKSDVMDYLGDVCEQPELHDWKKTFCNNFASALNGVLTDDSYVNRDDLPVDTICTDFLTHGFLKEAAKEQVARAEKEKQEAIAAQEAEAKREAEEKAAAAAREAAATAARERAKKLYEEHAAKVRAEMKAKADEARKRAAEEANATEIQHETEAVANSSASATASNSTVNVSKDSPVASSTATDSVVGNSTATDSVVANGTATTTATQSAAEVPANDTAVSTAANTTATVVPSTNAK